MDGFEKEKIIQNLLFMVECLILDDDFLELPLQRRLFSKRILVDLMQNDSPSLDYCMKLLRRGPNTFTQIIDIAIGTKQNGIVDLLLNKLP